MDIDRIRYFIAVCETGVLRRAAEAVHVTPPALSKAVKLLESEVGVRLTAPSGRGIRITDQGLRFARRMKPLLEQMARVKEELAGGGSREEPVRIGSFEVFTTHFLGPLMRKALPGCALVLQEFIPGQLERALLRGEADIGITYLPVPSAELDHLKAASVAMGVYARRGSFQSTPFPEVPFAVPVQSVENAPNKMQGLDGWPDGRLRRRVKHRVALMESALELCRQGLAAAYLPRFIARLHNEKAAARFKLAELDYPKDAGSARQAVYLIKRKSDLESGVLKRIAEVLREVCRD